jgi:hypothetical protein
LYSARFRSGAYPIKLDTSVCAIYISSMQQKIIIFFIFITGGFLFSSPAFSAEVYIPRFDPVYEQIFELQARGYLRELSTTEKPYLRSEVLESVAEEEGKFDPESKKLADLVRERLRAPQRDESRGLSGDFNFELALRGLSRERREGYFYRRDRFVGRGFKNELGSRWTAGWWLSKDGRWGADTRLIFDSDGSGYPWYYGRAHNARIIGQFDHAYFFLHLGRFDIVLGRQRMDWGPSPRGSLFLDGGSPPCELARLEFELKPFKLSAFATRLDDYYDPLTGQWNNRYLSGHRLSLRPGKSWEMAVSEVVLYGGPGRLFEVYYNIPILLDYWEGYNRSLDDNIIWDMDVSHIRPGLGRFYLQVVADDIIYKGNGPQKLAFQIGAHLVPSRYTAWSALAEINFVDTYVFGQRKRRNAYLNWGTPIGRLDSDQLEIFAGIYKDINTDLSAGFEYTRREKGEYDAIDPQPGPLPKNTKFPSGTVESIDDLRVLSRLAFMDGLESRLAVGYQAIGNYDRIEGWSLDQFYATVEISYGFETGLPFWKKYR